MAHEMRECCGWHRRIDTIQQRFEVLTEFNSEAVLGSFPAPRWRSVTTGG
jgi:hypothetical protein